MKVKSTIPTPQEALSTSTEDHLNSSFKKEEQHVKLNPFIDDIDAEESFLKETRKVLDVYLRASEQHISLDTKTDNCIN